MLISLAKLPWLKGKFMTVLHDYTALVIWTGNRGQGTKTYGGYARSWDLCSPGKPVISCSNDPVLGGNPALYNPEDR